MTHCLSSLHPTLIVVEVSYTSTSSTWARRTSALYSLPFVLELFTTVVCGGLVVAASVSGSLRVVLLVLVRLLVGRILLLLGPGYPQAATRVYL